MIICSLQKIVKRNPNSVTIVMAAFFPPQHEGNNFSYFSSSSFFLVIVLDKLNLNSTPQIPTLKVGPLQSGRLVFRRCQKFLDTISHSKCIEIIPATVGKVSEDLQELA